MGEKTFPPLLDCFTEHGCSQRSGQRAFDIFGFGTTRMPSDLLVLLLYSYYFKKLLLQLLISSGCAIILALKALCKARGGPS